MQQIKSGGAATGGLVNTPNSHEDTYPTERNSGPPVEDSTTDDCMSNGDDESDRQSVHSRRDSMDPKDIEKDLEPADKNSVDPSSSGNERGHKHNLAEQESGQQALLRKACDLCTKRKRKCNGKQPCSQCLETGVRHLCVFSPRLKSGRKKKVRVDGGAYDNTEALLGMRDGRQALVAGSRRSSALGLGSAAAGYMVDPASGRFSASGAVGLAGHVENFFLATYLRDFNRIVPLTTEGSVTEGMLEVLSPAVSTRGLSEMSPIPQPVSRRQAKLAVFWGVVAMGSRILGAEDEATARYLSLMRAALRECSDNVGKEVVQAYLLLSTVETMRGNEEAGKRFFDHAHTMHNGNAVAPEGGLRVGRAEQDESLDLVFQMFGQPDGCVRLVSHNGAQTLGMKQQSSMSPDNVIGSQGVALASFGPRGGTSADAVDQMIAQAMSPPSESQSGPLKALKYLSTACGLSSEVFDPTNKCVTVKQYLGEMDTALKGADSLFKHTDLSECITGVVMVKIWGGVTVLMRSWGKPEDKEIGLAQVEEGIGYALTRPGLMTFPMWWHALHCAAVVTAHFGHNDTYRRLRTTFNKSTFPGTEMPPLEMYSPGAICPQVGGSCSKLAYWLQVRGTMCGNPGWKPHFKEHLSEASETAAYAAALHRQKHPACQLKQAENTLRYNMAVKSALGGSSFMSETGDAAQEDAHPDIIRAALDAGMVQLDAVNPGLEGLTSLNTDLDLDPLGVDLDLSQLKDLDQDGDTGVDAASTTAFVDAGSDLTEIIGGGEMSHDLSFGITGGAMLSKSGSSGVSAGLSSLSGGEALSRQSSLDMNVIMQMVSSDEELKKKGGNVDVMDSALAFGDGPAKELYGVELSL